MNTLHCRFHLPWLAGPLLLLSAVACAPSSTPADTPASIAVTPYRPSAPGTVWTAGLNENGQLGRSAPSRHAILTPASGTSGADRLTGVVALAGGGRHSLAVLADGRVLAWGANDQGQLGDGTRTDSAVPVAVAAPDGADGPLRDAVAVAADTDFSMALLGDGTVVTWGTGDAGQRGIGTRTAPPRPTIVRRPDGRGPLTGVSAIAADGRTELALLHDGRVLAWGANGYGMVGDGTTVDRTLPVPVRGLNGSGVLTRVTRIAVGGQHALAVLADGTIASWGHNDSGQLGDGTRDDRRVPGFVGGSEPLRGVADVSAAEKHNYALLRDGSVRAWGNNTAGQLGDGTDELRSAPVKVVGAKSAQLRGVTQVQGGEAYGAAVLADGTALTWGAGGRGQLGSGEPVTRERPGPLVAQGGRAPTGVLTIAPGERHLLVLLKGS